MSSQAHVMDTFERQKGCFLQASAHLVYLKKKRLLQVAGRCSQRDKVVVGSVVGTAGLGVESLRLGLQDRTGLELVPRRDIIVGV